MNNSDLCTRQRDREAKSLKSFLAFGLLGSAVLHGVVLALVLGHQLGRSPESHNQSVEVTVVPPPESKSEHIQPKSAAAGGLDWGKDSSTEPGSIDYMPSDGSGGYSTSSQTLAELAGPVKESVPNPEQQTNQKTTSGAPGDRSTAPDPSRSESQAPPSISTAPKLADPREETGAISRNDTPEKPLSSANSESKPQSETAPSFTSVPSLAAASALNSQTPEKTEPKAVPPEIAPPSFTSVPSLSTASASSSQTAGKAESRVGSPAAANAGSNPNDWATNLRNSISAFLSGSGTGNSASTRTGGRSGVSPSGSSSGSQAVGTRGSSGASGILNPSSPIGAGAAALGNTQTVTMAQGLAKLFSGNTSGNDQAVCVVCLDPLYPVKAAALGRTGNADLRIDVDADGNVTKVQAINSNNNEFVKASIEALKNWKLNRSSTNGSRSLTVHTNFTNGGAAISVGKPGLSTSTASRSSQDASPASQLLAPTNRRNTSDGQPSVSSLDAPSRPASEPQPANHAESGMHTPPSDSAPQQPSSDAVPAQPSAPEPAASSNESSSPSVHSLQEPIPTSSDNKASATP